MRVLLNLEYCNLYSVEITFQSHEEERIKQVVEGIRTQTLEKMWKNMNSKINHSVRINGGYIEQDSIYIDLVGYFHDNMY